MPAEPIEQGKMMLFPPAKHLCQTCAVQHAPEEPHNAQSFYYQTKFHMEHGRSPNWLDAMEHCTPHLQALWTSYLEEAGVDVKGGGVNPTGAKT